MWRFKMFPLILSPSFLSHFLTLPLKPLKLFIWIIFSLLFFSGSLGMPRWLLCSVYCVLECVSRWLCVLHIPICIPMSVRQTDTVYVLNMCKEYLSRAEFQLYPVWCQSSQVLACSPQLVCSLEGRRASRHPNIYMIKLLAEIFPAEILESISNKDFSYEDYI